ncbi:MAG: HlyD family efflux transporter periplasmic adaptor subunit [Clostridia bacterium]|nr:HlyD family efflux transporter periplasmic adaptor subunit [Clostridia bacterium]
MKKILSVCLCALLAMAPAALAEGIEIEGRVEPARTLTIAAPYTGTVGDFAVQAGDVIAAGEALFPLSTQKVYAQAEGVVSGVFAVPGDLAETVAARYGALCYVERIVPFEAACTTSGADGDVEDKIVHPGETVYLKSTQSSERDGEGRVTGVTAQGYTVEVTDEGDLRIGENIKVYRDKDHDADSCIGSGRVSLVAPQAITAGGCVLACHVSEGQLVARGDLLFEMVPDQLDGMQGCAAAAVMPQEGVLLSVSAQSGMQAAKDSVMATYCPAGEYEVICPVDEADLAQVKIGARVRVVLDAYEDAPVDGEITKIASSADASGAYPVTVKLLDTQNVRIGMTATVAL